MGQHSGTDQTTTALSLRAELAAASLVKPSALSAATARQKLTSTDLVELVVRLVLVQVAHNCHAVLASDCIPKLCQNDDAELKPYGAELQPLCGLCNTNTEGQ